MKKQSGKQPRRCLGCAVLLVLLCGMALYLGAKVFAPFEPEEDTIPNDVFAVQGEAEDSVEAMMLKIVCLTFDDGPSPNTEPILEILREKDVPATFFVTAQDGIGGNVSLTKGDYVSPSGQPLLSIIQYNPIRVVFSITDKDYLEETGKGGLFAGEKIRLNLQHFVRVVLHVFKAFLASAQEALIFFLGKHHAHLSGLAGRIGCRQGQQPYPEIAVNH